MKLLSIAQSGMQAAQARLDASAHNVANLSTPGFRALKVESSPQADGGVVTRVDQETQPGVSLETELVQQRAASYAYKASLKVVQTEDRLMGSLLDIKT